MKLLVLTTIIAAVASSPLTQSPTWPWQVGKEYIYDVNTYTWTKFEQSNSNGNAFKAQFIIRVLESGHLIVNLDKPMYAQIQDKKITYNDVPLDLNYQPVQITEQPFEVFVEGGRVISFIIPSSLSVENENLLKALISALQVDLSPSDHVHSFPNSYDKENFQGLFKKMESDVTGDCETLYSISPVSAEWRRELPKFASIEDPIEIVKSKNYGSCQRRVALKFGVPEGAVWNGIASENEEKQFIKHTSESRLLAGKEGTIYKSESISSVLANPLLFGTQKVEVYSFVKVYLSSVQQTNEVEWEKTEKKEEEYRSVNSLLFSMSESMFFPKVGDQNIANAQKLLQEITPLLQNPNQLPKADFLSKFNVLVRVLTSLSPKQLDQMTNSIVIAKSSKNVIKNNMWIIYRDAVAQTGTIAAFEQIKSWILTKKVQGEEAGELIHAISYTLRYPSYKVMTEFFDFVTNPVVTEQQFLNNSALLAATKFLRYANNDFFVVRTVISRFSEELKQAVEKGDSNKAQVYVRLLGNLAHPDILKVFAPYLDGRIAITKYLRIQIVASLKTLANMKNDYIRAVLFSILRNTAEPYEVRVVAALNIFLAFPTAEMMQIMSHMTNTDPSTEVRAVLANGINFAAGLKDPRFAELAKTAQSVKNIVAKEKFGYSHSTESMIDEYTSDDDIAFFREMSFVGSEDSILPKYHRAALRARGTGWTEENQLTLSISGVQQILEYITKMMYEPHKSKVDLKYSAKKIAETLNIKRVPRSPLEGALFLDNMQQQKLITFNEEDLKSFIASTIKNMEQLFNGVNVQYTKVLNHKQVYVVFPLVAGVPFIYEYSEPFMYSVNGQVNIKLNKDTKDFAGSLHKELDFVYTRNLHGRVGFQDTLGNVYASAGVINKIQFYLPTKLNTVINTGEIKMNFNFPVKDTTLIHLSVWPYTALQKFDSLSTVSENPATKFIKRPVKVDSTDIKIGYKVGVIYQLKGYSYSNDFKDTSKHYDEADFLKTIGTLLYQKDVALTQYSLKYLAKETKNKDITFSLFYDRLYNQKQNGEMGPASQFKDGLNGAARREEIVKRVTAGIDSAEVQLFDLSADFDGQQKVEYVLTAAIADSFVDNKVQGAFFLNGWEQINAVFKMIKPKITPMNFEEALKNKIKVTYEADLKIGNSENIHLQGFGERSEKSTDMLSNDPIAKHCLKETSKQNFYQKDCYKMIIKAHAPDYFKATVTYKDITPAAFNTTFKTVEFLKQMFSGDQQEDVLKTIDDDKVEIEAQVYYYDNYINFEFTTEYGVLRFNNVEGMYYYPYAMAIYAPINSWERSRNWFTGYQYLPYCAVDHNKVWTFSGRNYDYSLTSSWHVVMVDDVTDWANLVILARRPSNKQAEVYMSYKTDDGKYVELEITPSAVEVKSNTKKVSEGTLTMYWNDIDEIPLLQYYILADGIMVFNINNGALRVMYDSQRLVIFTDDHRSSTRGICGQSTSQVRDDYMTPWGLVDRPEYYGASFSLDGEFSDPKTVELKKEAKLKAYQPVTKSTNILHCDSEWNKLENRFSKEIRSIFLM